MGLFAPWYEAVRDFFRRAKHVGQDIPVVFAAPDRAHNEVHRVTSRRSGLSITEVSHRPTPVPFMSVWMTPPKFDQALFNPGTIRGFDYDTRRGTAKKMRWPRPYGAEVQVDLWCGSAGGDLIAQDIQGKIDLQFIAESVYLPVDWSQAKWYRPPFDILEHAKVLGRTRIRLVHEGWTDTSDIEAGEGRKEIRRTFSGRIADAYIPYPPQEARLVVETAFQLLDESVDPPEVLEETVSGAED